MSKDHGRQEETAAWLLANKELRMDANNDLFSESRRQFHLDRYLFAQPFCENQNVLDGACGTGYGTALLGNTAKHATGIDISSDAISYATNTYGTPHIDFRQSPVEYTSFDDGAFDVVVSFETVEHTLCPVSHVMEVARLLNPFNGRAILSVPNNWGLTDHHFFDFNYLKLKAILDRFFEQVAYFYQIPREKGIEVPHIGPLSEIGNKNAQCIIAVCSGLKKQEIEDRFHHVMTEIYENAFIRHNEYRTLLYRQNTPLPRRALNKFKKLFKT